MHLQHWLTDKRARDQFLIQCSVDLEIYWNIGAGHLKPELFDHRTVSFIHNLREKPLSSQFLLLASFKLQLSIYILFVCLSYIHILFLVVNLLMHYDD